MKNFRILLVLLLASATGNAWGGYLYTVTDLGVLSGGTESVACGINNKGQVVGYSDTANGNNHAFLYSGGVLTDLGVLSGGVWSEAYGINDNGVVVGESYPSGGSYAQAFVYSGGTMQYLGVQGVASSINNAGQIVGGDGSQAIGFIYDNGTITDLSNLPSGMRSYGGASCINNAGQIVGGSGPWTSAWWHATFYANSSSSPQDLGTLGALASGTHSLANCINDNGDVVGWFYTGSGAQDAFLYSGRIMEDLGPGYANGINNSGQIVGSKNSQAFLYDDGTMYNLNSLLAPGSRWNLYDATAVNNKGQIVGYGLSPAGQTDAFLLTPTPEPSTLVLLAVGAVALIGYRLRKKRTATRNRGH